VAARIAVSQPLNSAWPPRAGSEAFATSIRSISPLPDRIRRRGFKGAIHIEHLSNHCGSAPVPKLNQEIKMFSKFALSAAIVISAACPALAATKHHHRVTHVHPTIYNMVPDTDELHSYAAPHPRHSIANTQSLKASAFARRRIVAPRTLQQGS
jgi:hypothetical protein